MHSRPSGQVIIWASDALYPGGPNVWSSTATKVIPTLTMIATGFLPDESPPAPKVNYVLNMNGSIIQYLDMIDVQNWGPLNDVPSDSGPDSSINGLAYNDLKMRFWSVGVGSNGFASRSNSGQTWVTVGSIPATPNEFFDVASSAKPQTDETIVMVGNSNKVYVYLNGAWQTPVTVLGLGVNQIGCVIWDSFRGVFWAGSNYVWSDPNLAPLVLKSNAIGASWSTHNLPHGHYDGTATYIQASATCVIAITTPDGSGPIDTYVSTDDGATWTQHSITDGSGNINHVRGFAYSAVDDTFMLLITVGSNGFVYTTSDGVTWTKSATAARAWIPANALTCQGSIWLAGETWLSTYALSYSNDRGTTWTRIVSPGDTGGALDTLLRVGNTGTDGRFYALFNGAGIDSAFSFSLRAGS